MYIEYIRCILNKPNVFFRFIIVEVGDTFDEKHLWTLALSIYTCSFKPRIYKQNADGEIN